MEISFCSHPNNDIVIATIFGTWHDSWAVVACAKFCRDMITSNWIKAKWNFHRIWIVMEKSLVKWVPGALRQHANTLVNHRQEQRCQVISLQIRQPHIWCCHYLPPGSLLRWGHPSHFHTATTLLIRYEMLCMREISYRLIWMKFINMLSVCAQCGTHRRFNWWIIAVLTLLFWCVWILPTPPNSSGNM